MTRYHFYDIQDFVLWQYKDDHCFTIYNWKDAEKESPNVKITALICSLINSREKKIIEMNLTFMHLGVLRRKWHWHNEMLFCVCSELLSDVSLEKNHEAPDEGRYSCPAKKEFRGGVGFRTNYFYTHYKTKFIKEKGQCDFSPVVCFFQYSREKEVKFPLVSIEG